MAKFLAHVRDDGTEQTVGEHLKGTADLARSFAEEPFQPLTGFSGSIHDIGKFRDSFQLKSSDNEHVQQNYGQPMF